MAKPTEIIGLDIGDKRIGVARISTLVGIAEPLATIANDSNFNVALGELISEYGSQQIVVGLPRNLSGKQTAQTEKIIVFSDQLSSFGLPVVFQDETLSSRQAEERADQYKKFEIDAVAACIILEDYIGNL
jgi:putative Holliday junction resolvase